MPPRRRFAPSNLRWFNRLLKLSYGTWLRVAYRLRVEGEDEIRRLRPPYVIVANHVTTRDPFLISIATPEPVWWVASDSLLRTRAMRFLLGLVGTIPKSKSIPDIDTINLVVDVIRKKKGVVGLFPEGAQTWDGRPLPLMPATAKLIKLLKVPIIAVRIKGGYLSFPRWSWKRRPGRLVLEFAVILSPAEIKALSAEELLARMGAAIAQDEFAWQRRTGQRYRSLLRAEHVELALFTCPDCGNIGSLRSRGSRVHCVACGESTLMDRLGFFRKDGGGKARFGNIPDWDAWQLAELETRAAEALAGPLSQPLFADAGVVLLQGRRLNPLRRLRTGTLILFPDRLELATLLGERLVFALADLDGVTVQKRHFFEFYRGRDLFTLRFPLRSISGRKWQVAIEALGRARVAASDSPEG